MFQSVRSVGRSSIAYWSSVMMLLLLLLFPIHGLNAGWCHMLDESSVASATSYVLRSHTPHQSWILSSHTLDSLPLRDVPSMMPNTSVIISLSSRHSANMTEEIRLSFHNLFLYVSIDFDS